MGLKDPAVVGEQSFEGVSQEVDEEQPQSSGKEDGTQHRPGLHWYTVSVQRRHNTVHSSIQTNMLQQNTEPWITSFMNYGGFLTFVEGCPWWRQSCLETGQRECTGNSSLRSQLSASWTGWLDRLRPTHHSVSERQELVSGQDESLCPMFYEDNAQSKVIHCEYTLQSWVTPIFLTTWDCTLNSMALFFHAVTPDR